MVLEYTPVNQIEATKLRSTNGVYTVTIMDLWNQKKKEKRKGTHHTPLQAHPLGELVA